MKRAEEISLGLEFISSSGSNDGLPMQVETISQSISQPVTPGIHILFNCKLPISISSVLLVHVISPFLPHRIKASNLIGPMLLM